MATNVAESERLWLQVLNFDHLEEFRSLMNDPRGKLWTFSEHSKGHFSEERAKEYILGNRPSPEKPYIRRWAIVLRPQTRSLSGGATPPGDSQGSSYGETGRMIGAVGIPRPGEIGYRVHPDFWGKGYMKEALGLAIKLFWGFEENRNRDKLIAAADPENYGSIRVLEYHNFLKGELKKDFYEREVEGETRKANMQFFFLNRPAIDNPHDILLPE